METLVRAIGALASVMLLLVILVIVKQATSPKLETKLPRGLKSPGLAIEFAELSEIEGILDALSKLTARLANIPSPDGQMPRQLVRIAGSKSGAWAHPQSRPFQ